MTMTTKPILFWPKPLSEIEVRLGQAAGDFMVVDTNSIYDLQKLYKITRATPIFDPFPRDGQHYREFKDHIVSSGCPLHIAGLKTCQRVMQARNDPSLAHASIEELLAAIEQARTGFQWRAVVPVDWSHLNWANTAVAAILAFVAALIGNVMFAGDSLIAAAVAMLVFAALYVCVRLNVQDLLFSVGRHRTTGARPDPHGQRG